MGQLRCLGSPIHLRHRYGTGYQLEVFVNNGHDEGVDGTDAVAHFMREKVSDRATLLEAHPGRCLFQLPPVEGRPEDISLATVFTELSLARQRLGITEYSLWRPSLEQVFLRFAREQHSEEEQERGHGHEQEQELSVA